MKKIMLLISLCLLLLSGTPGFSQNGETSITSNLPQGVSGSIAVSQMLQTSSRPEQPMRQNSWQFHNPKIGSLLNQKLNRFLSIYNQRSGTGSNSNKAPNNRLPETICVQIKCTARSQKNPDQYTSNQIRKKIKAAGGSVTGYNRNHTIIQALIPLTAANSLANLPEVSSVHLPNPAIPFGNFTTEALDDINADNWHNAGIYGQNTKIGIIDVGFIGYNALKGIDLPTTIVAKNFVDGESDSQLESYSEHGTACAEVVYDVAPGATMYLAKIYTNIDLQEAANWMQTNNVDIISTSLGFYNMTPGDGTGGLADTVTQADNAGILWVTAAGNDRLRHWGGLFSDPEGNGMHNFNSGQEINFFGPGDGSAWLINPGLKYSIFARWSDWNIVDQDYDIYVYRWNGSDWGSPIASSVNLQDGSPGQVPTEVAEFTTSGDPTAYGFIIYHSFAINREVNFEIFLPYAPRLDEITNNRSLANLADAPRAITVSAMDVNSYIVQSYSSMGPTNGPGGTITGGINKPDITSYTNVSSNSYGPLGFSGTSAATPHVAGTAALVLSQNPTFSPAQLRDSLKNQTIDIGTPGFDFATGWGRLHLDDQTPVPPPTCETPSSIAVPESSTSGSYQVSWSASSTGSVTYVLEEASNSSFSSSRVAYSGSGLTTNISGKPDGTYFYRVKATRNEYTDSSWRAGGNGCTVSIISPENVTWEGYSIYWNNSSNWSSNAIPGNNDEITVPKFPTGGNQPLISGISTNAKKLSLSGRLTISSGKLTIGN